MSTAFVLATRSTHKQREIQQILDTAHILTLDDAGIAIAPDEDDIEAFDTFRENAIAKARYFFAKTRRPTIADDSGILLDDLDGEPGVRSRRFANRPDLSGIEQDLANNQTAVDRLRSIGSSASHHVAHYMCVAALVTANDDVRIAIGSCSGIFLLHPRGNGGFGYDPHFLIPSIDRTFGELSDAEKHRFSHRARAFRALAPMLH
jgi:XTP/dITP diphosphohydrolase